MRAAGQPELAHEQVVLELNKHLLEYESSLGLGGAEFDHGTFARFLFVFVKSTARDYELAVKWLKLAVFDCVFERSRVRVALLNMLKEIRSRRLQPADLQRSALNHLYFAADSNLCANDLLKQEAFLNGLLAELDSDSDRLVQQRLRKLQNQLLADSNTRFHLCADLNKLSTCSSSSTRSLDEVWLEHFPASLTLDGRLAFVSPRPFDVQPTWTLKKQRSISIGAAPLVHSPAPGTDLLIKLGSTESAYLKLVKIILTKKKNK